MANINAFNGYRYNLKVVKPQEIICPPYDVINEEEKQRLRKLSKYNFVHIELPESYEKAEKNLNNWIKNKVLIKDNQPSIYIYQQKFNYSGKEFTRTGFFCVLKLPDVEKGKNRILKHEKVSQTPVKDRLELLRKTQTNTSPIFCLVEDKKKNISKLLYRLIRNKPTASFTDTEKILHRYWVVKEERFIKNLIKNMKNEEPFIADGHHRWTTAMLYRDEIKKTGNYSSEDSYNYVLIYIVPAQDKGILVLPTYRVVKYRDELKEKIKKYFVIKNYSSGNKIPYIVTYHDGKFSQIVPKNEKYLKEIPVVLLHKILLDDIYSKDEIFYTKSISEAVEYAQKSSGVAFFIDKPDMKKIFHLSRKGEIMPHKTTYFYPKVPAGIVIHKF